MGWSHRRRRTTTRRRRRRRAAADRVELPRLELERGELVVGESASVASRCTSMHIVRRRAAVDRHEVGEVAPPGQPGGRDSGLSPLPRLCERGEVRFTTDSQVREIRDLTR